LDTRLGEKEIEQDVEKMVQPKRAEIDEAVAAGRLSPEQAEQWLARARKEAVARLQQEMGMKARQVALERFKEGTMSRLHEEVAEAVRDGRMSAEEGRAALERIHTRLAAWLEAEGAHQAEPGAHNLDQVRDELKRAVTEGKVTRAEAEEKLEALE